jgi:hypothetical protein
MKKRTVGRNIRFFMNIAIGFISVIKANGCGYEQKALVAKSNQSSVQV